MQKVKKFTPKSRKDWRNWLKNNHKKEKRVSVIVYKKHTEKPTISHREFLEEAICFGWIDSTIKRIDEDKFIRNFARRTNSSRWSKNTLKYARQLIKENKMAPEGLRRYKEGSKRKTHDHELPKNPKPPTDLLKALSKNKKAQLNFKKMAPSYKRIYLIWILTAKLKETRDKRIKDVVQRLKENKKPGV